MAELLVRDIPESLVEKLNRRAVEHGISAEEEHRRILRAALAASDEEPAPTEEKPKRTLFDAFRELGQIAPDFEFERDRKDWGMQRKLDL